MFAFGEPRPERLLQAGLLPLYDALTEGYAVHLEDVDEAGLGEFMRQWRADLHAIA